MPKCYHQARYRSDGTVITNPGRYLINTCVDADQCFGWGDRQRAIVTTYLISVLSNRSYGILMNNPCRLESFLAPNNVNWIVKEEELDGLCARDFYMYNDLAENFRQHQMIEWAHFDKLFPEDVIYFHTAQDYVTSIRRNKLTADVMPWLHNFTLGQVYGYVMRHLFVLNNYTKKQLDDVFSNQVKGRSLVCAHIRMGIKGVDAERTARNEMHAIWEFLQRYNDVSKYSIYVATDSNETKLEAKKLFREQFVDTVGLIDQMERVRDCGVFRRVIVEQQILTRCDVLVLTRSSLGLIAAFMRDTNKGLHCFFKERVFPCRMEVLHELHDYVL
ncbi:hypothetical protein ACJMK2_018967 [Sinanodonta woodiana]|uniref:GT23 domain-containing protein n=1 Tax=Sinanodonta woodiana TaxID=1069815 RepID=A0ABD3UH00_SINWO